MDYTQNLHLPQWEKTDRIMMDDFNAAMEKIDAAMAAETAARQATDTAVDKLGAKLLLDYTLSETTATAEIDVSGIDWSAWHSITIQFVPITNNASGASYVCVGGTGSSDRIGMCRTQTGGEYYTSVIRLFPLFSDTARIASYNLSPENNGAYYASSRFSNCHTLYLVAGNTGVQLTNGTRVKIWGQT